MTVFFKATRHDGWDQAAYDRLTGPWRDVIGPIHPDDGDEGLGLNLDGEK